MLYCFYLRTSDAFINKIIVIVINCDSGQTGVYGICGDDGPMADVHGTYGVTQTPLVQFLVDLLADRTIGRAYGTVCRLSVCLSSVCLSSVCDVLYCGKTVRPSQKVSEGVSRKPGSKSSFFGSPPYFYFRFRRYGHRDGRFCLIFAPIAQQSVLDGRN